jgi:hypothetical protein
MIRGGGGFTATNTIVMPTQLLKDLPKFADYIEAEDIPFQLLGALKGYAWYDAETLIAYRLTVPGSWSTRQYASSMETRIKTSRDIIALNEGYTNFPAENTTTRLQKRFNIRVFDSLLPA